MSARLHEIAAALSDAVVDGGRSAVEVLDVEHDSRRVEPGALFACISGDVTDGHMHAPAAVEAGAIALLVERPLALGVPEIVVSDVRRSLGPAASIVHGDPSRRIDVVGVTGTNGKTTTVRIVASLIRELGGRALEIGTLTGVRTTPEAPELQRELAAALDDRYDIVAVEVSSHALDLHRVDGTRFRVAGFTNLGVDHLDHHGGLDDYFEAKARLFDPVLSEAAVINVVGAAGRRLADRVTIPVVEIDDSSFDVVALGPLASRFRWRGLDVELPLGGEFNVANAVLAAEIVVSLGHPPAAVVGALSRVPAIPGRFESLDEGQVFTVIVDYAHTPDGLEAVLEAARGVTQRDLVVVFGAGGNRDRGKRPQMGDVVRRLADRVVVTSDNPRNEPPDVIISGIVSGMDHPPELIEPDRRMAMRHAFAGARDGDVVLIAGKGHETTQTIADQVLPFDDRLVAREELQRLLRVAS